jgi:hypothetical protein
MLLLSLRYNRATSELLKGLGTSVVCVRLRLSLTFGSEYLLCSDEGSVIREYAVDFSRSSSTGLCASSRPMMHDDLPTQSELA